IRTFNKINHTMLDNNVMLFANDLHHRYSHSPDPTQVFMAGSGGGYSKTGRNIVFPPVDKNISGRSAPNNHTQMLTSILQYMGVEADRVGDPSIGPAGTLPLLR